MARKALPSTAINRAGTPHARRTRSCTTWASLTLVAIRRCSGPAQAGDVPAQVDGPAAQLRSPLLGGAGGSVSRLAGEAARVAPRSGRARGPLTLVPARPGDCSSPTAPPWSSRAWL